MGGIMVWLTIECRWAMKLVEMGLVGKGFRFQNSEEEEKAEAEGGEAEAGEEAEGEAEVEEAVEGEEEGEEEAELVQPD